MKIILKRNFKMNRLYYSLLAVLLFVFILYLLSNLNSSNLSSKQDDYVNLKKLLVASISAAERGGQKVALVRELQSLLIKSKGLTAEGANDPVTDGDMLSHKEMYFSLKKAFPSVKIISEERGFDEYDEDSISSAVTESTSLQGLLPDEFVPVSDVVVWIDPLDATQEYTENLLQYVTTMVCVAVNGVPVIGVIHKPFEKFTAWVWVGKSYNTEMDIGGSKMTYQNGDPVKVIVSRSHQGYTLKEKVAKAFGSSVQITNAGGAGYKVLEVLSGRQDVYFHNTAIKKWDICAGNAILSHFGGNMTTIEGKRLRYDSNSDLVNLEGLVAAASNHDKHLVKIREY